MTEPVMVWMEGCPKEVIQRGDEALAWAKCALILTDKTPLDAPERPLVDANYEAALREVRAATAVLREWHVREEA